VSLTLSFLLNPARRGLEKGVSHATARLVEKPTTNPHLDEGRLGGLAPCHGVGTSTLEVEKRDLSHHFATTHTCPC
jgi:hypothetical protein